MDSNFTQYRRLFALTGGQTGSPPQEAPLPMFDQERCAEGGWTCDDEV